jgi:AcrR family transcriptional regulator
VDQSESVKTQQQEISRRQERAERILDAAMTLILRWGFQKTTLDDISRQARVAKGTLYLHWKTREDLFTALVVREKLVMSHELKQSISEDPAGSTLRGMLKHSALALMKRPLLKAALLRDTEMLGKLAHSAQNDAAYQENLMGFKVYLEFLREHGLVRTDIGLNAQVYMFSAILAGFFLIAPLMPEEFKLADEELADLMAETAHRALETERTASPDTLQQVSHAFTQYIDQAVERTREQYQQDIEG